MNIPIAETVTKKDNKQTLQVAAIVKEAVSSFVLIHKTFGTLEGTSKLDILVETKRSILIQITEIRSVNQIRVSDYTKVTICPKSHTLKVWHLNHHGEPLDLISNVFFN